ncbi:MAG TPA: NAD(P)-binding domain-containing protein [Xanthobacteraceae bacterium]|nr:NAD(P)-binding domain-containing protein [Xanthobacteraceae bacterium]
MGFIGLGVMGASMCANLVAKAGRPVAGFDVRPEPAARLASAGTSRAGYGRNYYPAMVRLIEET